MEPRVAAPFFEADFFTSPSAAIARQKLQDKKIDHYLFSFHGLPESHIRKIEGCRIDNTCCLEKRACAKNCYRAQCFASAKKIAEHLGVAPDQWSVSFQSRLGRAEWLKPSTDQTLKNLAEKGSKNIAVLCPSFVADCIETLEEIGIGGEELFKEHGGHTFHLIPCVNEHQDWVNGFANFIKK
jgi:ferrochelatase